MIISFKTNVTSDGTMVTWDVKRDTRSVLSFPQYGVDIMYNYDVDNYTVYFDTEIELDESIDITKLIKKIKRIYLRKEKIRNILNKNG